jgi:hypothetical protein
MTLAHFSMRPYIGQSRRGRSGRGRHGKIDARMKAGMTLTRFSAIQRGGKLVLTTLGALLAFMVLWRVVLITVSDMASYLRGH